MSHDALTLILVAGVGAGTFLLGHVGSLRAKTTSDFLVARRAVRPRRNAAAISGEYLSAASFLGIAGLILKDGVDALWYPIGFTAGYLGVLLFVAAPLRRSGAYTIPDFAEVRLSSIRIRKLSTFFVVCIGISYLVPQLHSAGLTLNTITGLPVWSGGAIVTVIVMVNVLGGGMRSITLVQAFQYWSKLFAIAAPTFVLCTLFLGTPGSAAHSVDMAGISRFNKDITVTITEAVLVKTTEPITLSAHGTIDGAPVNGKAYWNTGTHQIAAGTELSFASGTAVPAVDDATVDNKEWATPQTDGISGLLRNYSLILATFLGTLGLPHVLVRFYTNEDGKAARRTALHVLYLLSLFYLFPTALGVLSRIYLPQLLITGKTDMAALLLPEAMQPNSLGRLLGAIIAAGAFAAFLATSSGLVASVAGVVSTDILKGKVRDFRTATVISGMVAFIVALLIPASDVSLTVSMSFALAASTFCPLLVLGIWWRGLTWVGAMAGLLVGGGLVIGSKVIMVISSYTGDWAPSGLEHPALVTVPVAFFMMIIISKLTTRHIPADINQVFLRLHAPDPLGFRRDREVAQHLDEPQRQSQL